MVGRELPNLRPNGEDHRGAVGGERTGMLRNTEPGEVTPGSVNWSPMKTRTPTVRGLSCGGVARASSVTR